MTGGLHCGNADTNAGQETPLVIPPMTGGLHCGTALTTPGTGPVIVIPP